MSFSNTNNLGRFHLRFGDENPNKPDNVAYLSYEHSASHLIAIRELDELWFGNHYFGKYLKAVANGFTNTANNTAFKIQNYSQIRVDVTNWNKKHYKASVENDFYYLPENWRSIDGRDESEQANLFRKNRHLNENSEDNFENANGGYYDAQGDWINKNGEYDVNVTVWAHEMDNNNNGENENFFYINKTGLPDSLAKRVSYPKRYFNQSLGNNQKRDREYSNDNLSAACSSKPSSSKKRCNVKTPSTSQTTNKQSSSPPHLVDLTTNDDDDDDQLVLDELLKILLLSFQVSINGIIIENAKIALACVNFQTILSFVFSLVVFQNQ